MITTAEALTALGIGLAGAGHCLGMCGGIASAISLGGVQARSTTIAYHGGRLLSYTLLGALLGALAGSINLAQWTLSLRYIAGFLLIAMGLSIADWWRGISVLERLGAKLWTPVQKASSGLLPVRHWSRALLLGLCWGLMPCGLIYSALAWAATGQDSLRSGTLMLLFGVGTLPAMLAVSVGAARVQTLLRRRGFKLFIALMLICAGLWTLYLTYSHSAHLNRPIGPDRPAGHESMDHSMHGQKKPA